MEGERLLAAINDKTIVAKDLRNYLGPLRSGLSQNPEKYQRFALKALKLVIQQLSQCSTRKDQQFHLKLCNILVSSVDKSPISIKDISPFCFEKLLINLIHQAAQCCDKISVESYCLLVKDRLHPLVTMFEEARTLLNHLSKLLMKIVADFIDLEWEKGFEMRLLSLEMSYCSHHDDLSDGNTELILAKRYSSLLLHCVKKAKLKEATIIFESILKKALYGTEDSADMIVADYVEIKKLHCLSKKQDKMKSLKDILIECGCSVSNSMTHFLKRELDEYEDLIKEKAVPTDLGNHWKLDVLEELALTYKTLGNSIEHGFVLVEKAMIVYEQGDLESAVRKVSEAIDIANLTQGRTKKEKCMTFDLLGHCYFWKALFIYFKMLRSEQNQLCDEEVVAAIASSVSSWRTLYSTISPLSIAKDEMSSYFHNIKSSCSHLRMCVSLCSALCLVPQALSSIEVLLFLHQCDAVPQATASLLAYKIRLIITYYGEKFVVPEVESALKEFVDTNCENLKCKLEAQIALALLYCKRGQFSMCNELLKKVSCNPVFTKNTPDSYYLMAQLLFITSQYIEAQSEYLPLVDINTCLTRLTTFRSPICINCIKEEKADCTCHHNKCDSSFNNGLTELELAVDSLNLTTKLMKSYGIHSTQQSKSESAAGVDIPTLMASPNSSELWIHVIQMLSSLSRVARLCTARESIKEAVHHSTEGLELARLLHLRYWKVEFLLLLFEIKDTLGKKDEGSELKEEIKSLLVPKNCEDTEDLTAVFNKLSLQPMEANDEDIHNAHVLNHPVACCCVECANPARLVLTANYLHQLIEGHSSCDDDKLLKCVDRIIDNEWPKVSSFVDNSINSAHNMASKQNSRTKKKARTSTSVHTSNEILQPIVIKNALIRIQSVHKSQLSDTIEECKKVIEMDSLHSPLVRLRLAELYYAMGVAKLHNMTDSETLERIYQSPVSTINEVQTSSVTSTKRKRHHRRTRRAIIDSDDDEVLQSSTPNSSLPVSLSGFVPEFITSYQLLTPTTLSSRLTKHLYSVLGVCLSIWQASTAAHFLLHSSYLSFSMDSILWTWKKIRRNLRKQSKNDVTSLILKEIQEVLSTPSSDHTLFDCTHPHGNLVKSQAILHPLTRPLPQSYTTELIQQLPSDWVYYNMALVDRPATTERDYEKGKVLILVRVAKNKDSVIVKLPLEKGIYSAGSPVRLLQTILSESRQCIESIDDKQRWWTARRKLDSDMENFLKVLQNKVFGIWKILLLNPSVSQSSLSISRIASALSNCGIPSSEVWAEILLKGRNAIDRKDHLKMILKSLCNGGDTCDDLLVEKIYREVIKAKLPDQSCPMVLSPCHPLHQLPFESMPLLRSHPVSRMPSLPFLTAHSVVQLSRHRQYIDPRSTYYIINPSGDLTRTEQLFGDWFKEEEGWEGVVGTPPTSEQFVYGFEERCVLIYCGHGKAREYLKSGHIQELNCQATVLQMGCSSGKLENLGGDIEPNGIVLNFLLAGSPSLVVNLWDITDLDIDRFCSRLVQEWLLGIVRTDHYKLLEVVPKARNECKLKYLVGASPVIYGTPPLLTHS